MLQKIRNSRFTKIFIIIFLTHFLFSSVLITKLYAIPNGPSQPEMHGPSAVSYDDFVDLFTGNFQYSIPLFEMGDIPLSLNYNAGVSMDEEAGWVGLGWNINPGSISRTVRGLPDDFKNDIVTNNFNIRDNTTYGASVSGELEIFGLKKDKDCGDEDCLGIGVGLGLEVFHNNYTGWGMGTSFSPSFSIGNVASLNMTFSGGSGSEGDIGITPGLSTGNLLSDITDGKLPYQLSLGLNISTQYGLRGVTIGSIYTNKPNSFTKNKYTKNKGSVSLGGFPAELFADQTYTPTIEHSLVNKSNTFKGSVGFYPAPGVDLMIGASGYGSVQTLKEDAHHVESNAYGYLYLNSEMSGDYLMDFNREKDGVLYETQPQLPIGYLTYDLFTVNSPGLSGTFRAYRNDIGYIKESNGEITSSSDSYGIEVSFGNGVSPGVDITTTDVESVSKTWEATNNADQKLKFVPGVTPNEISENVYFQMTDEITNDPDPELINTKLLGKKAAKFENSENSLSAGLTDGTLPLVQVYSDSYVRDERVDRSTNIAYHTVDDIQKYNPDYKYKICDDAQGHHIGEIVITNPDGSRYVYGLPAYNIIQKEVTFNVGTSEMGAEIVSEINTERNLVEYDETSASVGNSRGQDHYFNEIVTPAYAHTFLLTEILSPDYVDVTGNGPSEDDYGTYVEYIYGVPDDDDADGTPDIHDPDGDTQGDKYYQPNIDNYKWRTPGIGDLDADESCDEKWANYSEGLKSDKSDDKANYIYGEKEIWYINSVETKNYKAVFNLSDRTDGLGVEDVFGKIDDDIKLKKIDNIQLYSKDDETYYAYWSNYYEGTGDPDDDDDVQLYPVKTVYFEYDYSLCAGVPNKVEDPVLEGMGRLTLKKVYFTYNNSNKARYTPYSFEYTSNYDYDSQAYDRWGNYKPNDSELPNQEYPYVDQTDESAELIDEYAAAWCLNAINTPAGGRIDIEYESDDYSFVQDMPATQMYKVSAFTDSYDNLDDPEAWENLLYKYDPGSDETEDNYYLIFDLPESIPVYPGTDGITQEEADKLIKEKCISGGSEDDRGVGKNLYYRFFVNIDDDDNPNTDLTTEDEVLDVSDEKPEYVSGYTEVDFSAASGKWAGAIEESGYFTKGYVKLEPQKIKYKNEEEAYNINPVTKSAWTFSMMNTRYNVLDEDPLPSDMTFPEIMEKLGDSGFWESLTSLFTSPNKRLKQGGFGKIFDPEKSWIRLGSINDHKKGGGHRVKKITVFDNWENMTKSSPSDTEYEGYTYYGKEYTYKNTDGTSSGVASYEPLFGADEIALHRPASFAHRDQDYRYLLYQEYPFGESFFPSPIVGYSKVTVKNLLHGDVNVNATGKAVYEYHTVKDFPVKATRTGISEHTNMPNMGLSAFSNSYLSEYVASQGYAIEINDMHGKMKRVSIYAETNKPLNAEPISKVEYNYYQDEETKALNNSIDVIDEAGNVLSDIEIGVKYDFYADFREQYTKTHGNTVQGSLDVSVYGALILPIISALTSIDNGYKTVKTAVTTKVISRHGLLKEIVTTEDGSRVVQKNIYYDGKTCSPIISTTQNEFDDTYYSFSYPAHWVYDGMDLASNNSGFTFESVGYEKIAENGKIDNSLIGMLFPGDEVGLVATYSGPVDEDESYYAYYYCWVYYADIGTPGYYLIDRNGNKINLSAPELGEIINIKGKVFRSGHRNMPNYPVASILSRATPFNFDENKIKPEVTGTKNCKIISANASEFSEIWQNFCIEGGSDITRCNCHPELTEEGDELITMMRSLIALGKFNTDVELYGAYDDPDDMTLTYSYNFTPLLYEKIAAEGDLVNWFVNLSDATGPTILNIEIDAPQDNCKYSIDFGATTVSVMEDVFDNPDDYYFEFEVPSIPEGECGEIREFDLNITNKPGIPTLSVTGTCSDLDCITLRYCAEETIREEYCTGGEGDPANPYIFGLLGIWKPKVGYMYKTDRDYTYLEDDDPMAFDGVYTRIRKDGIFESFDAFWKYNVTEEKWLKDDDDWQMSASSVMRNPYISESENINALDIYSSSDYGYNNSLPVLVASNAAYQQVGYENFEDEALYSLMDKGCNPEHFDFSGVGSTKYAHTGNYSRQIPPTGTDYISYTYDLSEHIGVHDGYDDDFTISSDDCLPYFSPFADAGEEKYIVTVWIKEEVTDFVSSYDDLSFTATLGSSLPITEMKSPIVEDWQRIEYTFTIPENSTGSLELKFTNTGEEDIYIDDIRVQPADALANCYVYDFRTQKVMAELDENHYATFYEYDEEGKLIRVKKETERGIMTIQEGRYYTKKQ